MGYNSICEGKLRDSLIIKAILAIAPRREHHAVFGRGLEFFSTEITWIEQHGIANANAYSHAERTGRAEAPLDRKVRSLVFEV